MKHSTARGSQVSVVLLVLLLAAAPLKAEVVSTMSKAPVVGIDFGSSATRVGIFRNNSFELIPNERGSVTTPSFVVWDEIGRVLIGEDAKNHAWIEPENTVLDFKWLVGRSYDEAAAEAQRQRLPYKIINRGGKPAIRTTANGETIEHTPEEVTALLLTKIKRDAEAYLGGTVTESVITVPASFNDVHRQAIKDTATLAGLTVLRVINEPTAAIIASGVDKKSREENNVLVIDLGGGSFDVTLLAVDSGVFEVLALSSGDLGGLEIEADMMSHALDNWENQQGVDVKGDHVAMQQLQR